MSLESNKKDISILEIKHSEEEYETQTRKRKYKIVFSVIIISIILIVIIGNRFFNKPITVQVTAVINLSPTQAATVITASGYVVAQRQAAIASKATGRLVYLNVEEGDQVKKAQLLAMIENEDIKAQLDQAKANYNLAKATLNQSKAELEDAESSYKRIQQLFKEELVSQTEFDKAEARFKTAQAAVKAAEFNIKAMKAAVKSLEVALENTYIRAPFDGTVLNKYADIGEIVAPFAAGANAKASVLTIADMNSLQVEADVSESYIEKIRVGMPCEIILDAYPEKSYIGIVHKIVPTVDRSKATVLTKINFLNRDSLVLPEMSAKVSFLFESFSFSKENKHKKAVFNTAIKIQNNKKVAFLIDNDNKKVIEVNIETGDDLGDYIEIKKGLEIGNKVVLNPPPELHNGSKIKIIE